MGYTLNLGVNMFNINNAKSGDILLYKPTNLVGWFIQLVTWGRPHASMYAGNGKIYESHIDTGCVLKDLNPKWYASINVYRFKKDLDECRTTHLMLWMDSQVGKSYDLLAFPSIFFRSVLCRLLGLHKLMKEKPIFNSSNKYVCFEYVAVGYYNIGLRVCPDVYPRSTTGWDISHSSNLRLVG